MIADSFFSIGKTHTVCQDYATHWTHKHLAFAIVCDGCSDSPKTDVGARIIAETFSAGLKNNLPSFEEFFKNGITNFGANLRIIQTLLLANPAWFDATIVACIANEETQKAAFFLWGDGHIRIKHTNGETSSLDVDFNDNQNAPFYPSYRIFRQNGREDYEAAYGPLNPHRFWESNTLPKPNLEEEFPVFEIPLEGIQAINLYSDGVGSFFYDADHALIPKEEITAQLQDYKLIGNSLLQRRARKCQKIWNKDNIHHADDIGIATLVFPDATTPTKA